MGRDRHSNPRYPVHPLWKLQPVQTSLKLHTRLVSTPSLFLSLSHSLPAFVHLIPSLNLSFSMSLLPFLTPSLFPSLSVSYLCFSLTHFVSLFVFLRLSDTARLSFVVRLSLFRRSSTQIRERHTGISTVAITTWISPVRH